MLHLFMHILVPSTYTFSLTISRAWTFKRFRCQAGGINIPHDEQSQEELTPQGDGIKEKADMRTHLAVP